MSTFKLDTKLNEDSFLMGDLSLCQLRLMNNANVPWFILVPRIPTEGSAFVEFHCLSNEVQLSLLKEINRVSAFLSDVYHPDKVNVATIGNIVKQLHVHVVGRYKDDFCWPNVVWGQGGSRNYDAEEVELIRLKINDHFGEKIKMT